MLAPERGASEASRYRDAPSKIEAFRDEGNSLGWESESPTATIEAWKRNKEPNTKVRRFAVKEVFITGERLQQLF